MKQIAPKLNYVWIKKTSAAYIYKELTLNPRVKYRPSFVPSSEQKKEFLFQVFTFFHFKPGAHESTQ